MEREECYMVGMILWTPPESGKRQKRVAVEEKIVLHMRFACVKIVRGPRTPEAVVRRRVLSAAKRLRKLGVSSVVLPEGFPYGGQLAKYGVRPMSTLALRQALAAELTRAAMTSHGLGGGSAKVAVIGERLTGELVRTVTELSLRNRYILLDLAYGGEELCRSLRREYGVSLLVTPSMEQLEEADVLVMFAPRRELSRKNPIVLILYEGEEQSLPPLTLPPTLEEKLPVGCSRPQLLAALQEAGVLRTGQITVGTLGCDRIPSEKAE